MLVAFKAYEMVEVLERIEKRKDNIHLTYNVTANDAVHLHESKNSQKLTD